MLSDHQQPWRWHTPLPQHTSCSLRHAGCPGTPLCCGARQPHTAAWGTRVNARALLAACALANLATGPSHLTCHGANRPALPRHGTAAAAHGGLGVSQGSSQPLVTGLGSLAGACQVPRPRTGPRLEQIGSLRIQAAVSQFDGLCVIPTRQVS